MSSRLAKYLFKMREGLARVQRQQRSDRNRLSLNSETNRASHNSMVTDSIVETAIFILACFFQVTKRLGDMTHCMLLHRLLCPNVSNCLYVYMPVYLFSVFIFAMLPALCPLSVEGLFYT